MAEEESPRAARSKLAGLVHRLFNRGEHESEQLLAEALEELDRRPPQPRPAVARGLEMGEEKELAQRLLLACEQALGSSSGYLFARRQEKLQLLAALGESPGKVLLDPCAALCAEAEVWRGPQPVAELAARLPAEEAESLFRFGAVWLAGGMAAQDGRLTVLLLLGPGRAAAASLGAGQRQLLQALADRLATLLRGRYDAWLAAHKAEQKAALWLKECPECGYCFDPAAFICPHDDSDLEPTFLMERLLGGRYLLERRLGRGAAGAVYAAADREAGATVAVKILAAGDAMALGRFANEARAGRQLVHPNLVQVLDSGTLSRQSAYLVMELLAGRTLRQLLEPGRPADPARVARLFDQFLQGLAHAHDYGVVHRDLKPENIMVVAGPDGEEQVKILDFGLAKLLRAGSGPQLVLTMAGMVIGTLSYMAPEQLAGEPVDQAADLFATAVMVAEALTGRLPFRGANLGQMLRAVATQPFTMETATPAQENVARILGRTLEKNPATRLHDARQLREQLIPALLGCEPFG